MKIVVAVLTAHKVKEKEKDADQKRKQNLEAVFQLLVEAPPAQGVTFEKLV